MSDINVQLVREFFELQLFRVLTNWQQHPGLSSEHPAQIFVENTQDVEEALSDSPKPADVLLALDQVASLDRAIVEVRAWHGDRLYPSIIESNPVLHQFSKREGSSLAAEFFGNRPCHTVLVVSELPASIEPRHRALQLLQGYGIDYVIEFPTILHGILLKMSEGVAYTGSATLQTMRLLKRYRFLRNQQMEFGFVDELFLQAGQKGVDTVGLREEEKEKL